MILYYCKTRTKNQQKLAFTNPGRQVARENKFCTLASNICGSSACNLINFIHLALRILRRFPVSGKFITRNDDDNDDNHFIHRELYYGIIYKRIR
jgi:hypothetical protein